jgi:hypothetical protein
MHFTFLLICRNDIHQLFPDFATTSWGDPGTDTAAVPITTNAFQHVVTPATPYQDLNGNATDWNTENNLPQGSQYQFVPSHTGEKPALVNLREIIEVFITSRPEIANPILEFLERHHASRGAQITGLRACLVHLDRESYSVFPVVQWKEGFETDVMALFSVAEDGCCNSLMHYGEGNTWQQDGTRWHRATLHWSVFDFTQLKRLFAAAKQLLGMQHWKYMETIRNSYDNSNLGKEYTHLFPF